VQKQRIIEEARTWLGTRFQHQARVKKSPDGSHMGGCDCLGLIIGVLEELQLISVPHLTYSMRPPKERLINELKNYFIESNNYEIGDLAVLSIDDFSGHLAFIGDHPAGYSLIHSYLPARKVVEHQLDDIWKQKIIHIFEII